MEENKTVAKVAALQKQLQAMGRDIDVINFSLGVHTPKILRSLADDIESGKIEVKESKVTVEFDKDPDASTGNPNLTTGANCEKTLCHRGGALLAKKLKTGAAPKGEARRETQTPTNKCLRNQMPLDIAWPK